MSVAKRVAFAEDIDLEKRLIHVRRNVTHPQTNQPHTSTPKTKAQNSKKKNAQGVVTQAFSSGGV